jgi:hypothetical protein
VEQVINISSARAGNASLELQFFENNLITGSVESTSSRSPTALDRDEAPEVPRGPHISPSADVRAFHSGLQTTTSMPASPCDPRADLLEHLAPADGSSQGVRSCSPHHRGSVSLGISDVKSGDSPASRRGAVPPLSSRHDMASRLRADDRVPATNRVVGRARVAEDLCQSPKLLVVPDMPLQSLSFG